MSGRVILYGMDESFGEKGADAPKRKGRQIHPQPLACETGEGMEKEKP
jgi:hypothetical protein